MHISSLRGTLRRTLWDPVASMILFLSVVVIGILFSVAVSIALHAQDGLPRRSPKAGETGEMIWRGKIGGVEEVVWGTTDITLRSAGNLVYSLRARTETYFSGQIYSWFEQSRLGEVECRFERAAALLSVTDRYLGMRFDDERTCTGMPHPSVEARYATLDIRDSFRMVSLQQLFPPEDIRAALLGELLVKKALAERGIVGFSGSLDELLLQLSKFTESCAYMFPVDVLSRFVLYEISGAKVAVRLGLPHGCESARGNLTDITLWLPVPAELAPSLRLASTRKSGYLMRDGLTLGRKRMTSINSTYGIEPLEMPTE